MGDQIRRRKNGNKLGLKIEHFWLNQAPSISMGFFSGIMDRLLGY